MPSRLNQIPLRLHLRRAIPTPQILTLIRPLNLLLLTSMLPHSSVLLLLHHLLRVLKLDRFLLLHGILSLSTDLSVVL